MSRRESIAGEVALLLERDGLQAVLAYLNARTRHRYTGIYRFDPPMLRNIALHDRENPEVHVGSDALMVDTYCSIVGEVEAPFFIADSEHDDRVAQHSARTSIFAYCGAPVCDDAGTCVGSLCHFDVRPRLVPESEIPILEQVATLLWRGSAAVRDGLRRQTA